MKNPCLRVLLLPALLNVCGIAHAQDADDPPSRVARIAYIAGPVSFEPASVDQWAAASLNYPMTTGDSLYADSGARAVLRIGQNSIRLDSGANFQFLNLADNIVQTSINAGSLSLRVRHLFDSESWEVDTPNGAVTFLRTGEYRIDTDASRNATMVTVRSGDIEVTANNQSFPVHSGQTAYFDNSGNPPDIEAVSALDDFDSFIIARDRMEDAPPPQYVSPDMVGYEDLNANGDWRNTPNGPVWTPHVAAGWTPYHDGHWAWIAPWGWTWIDDEPWGFAPFHYGRWAYADGGWGWYPGVIAPRVYYAPALVAFVGGDGFGVGVSVGGGGGGGVVAWFPLGPAEQYYPSYHVSPTYIRQVNVTNTRITNINVTNINVTNVTYVNRSAVVAVSQNTFVSAQPVQRAVVTLNATQIQRAQVIGAAPKVAPQPQSVLANSSGRRVSVPPAAIASRPVVAKLAPPPPAVPFAAQQQMLQQHPGTPVVQTQLQTLRTQAATQSPAPGRVQVRAIDTKQVHAIAPEVHAGPAPALAQRPAQVQRAPQPMPAQAPRPQPVPAAVQTPRPPPEREQTQPAARPAAAPREQAQPAAPPVREQAQPVARPAPAPQPRAEPRSEPPARPQAQPAREPPPAQRPATQPRAEEKKSGDKKSGDKKTDERRE